MAIESHEPVSTKEVHAFLDRFVDAYESEKDGFFELFAEDASVFTISSPTRIDGVDAFRKGFQPSLDKGRSRRSQILSPRISTTGNTAVVTYHNRIQVDEKPINLRASLVLTRQADGELRITHLHNSPLESPSLAARTEEVLILEERVATSIGAVGTPK